ncbi:general transcription factor II-I repeat domain-containing protein 2A [Trichonephila clavipes]|nr:general transcription factor II-I repeat domain-containing protein 2A [Trichonephila clavipes]
MPTIPRNKFLLVLLEQGWRTIRTHAIDGTRQNILGTPPIKTRSTAVDSSIKKFSVRFSQFKELSEMFKFTMYPDVTLFDKLNLSQFDWLEIEEFEMQTYGFLV